MGLFVLVLILYSREQGKKGIARETRFRRRLRWCPSSLPAGMASEREGAGESTGGLYRVVRFLASPRVCLPARLLVKLGLPEVAAGTLLRWRIKGLSGIDVCIFSGLICIFLFVGDGDDFGTYFGVVGGILLLLLVAGARDLEELAMGVLGDGGSSRSVL